MEGYEEMVLDTVLDNVGWFDVVSGLPNGKGERMIRIFRKSNGCEITQEKLALEMYRAGSKIAYCDIEGISQINGDWYILDECGRWDYISSDKYIVKDA